MTEMHPNAAHLIDPEGRPQSILLASQRDQIRTALERSHHALATLHGLDAHDVAGGGAWRINETETLAAIDAALGFVAEDPVTSGVVNGAMLDPGFVGEELVVGSL